MMRNVKNLYYTNILKEHLDARQKRNASYSLRAFAKDLGLHPTSLSQVLRGKRGLPIKHALEVAHKLQLSPKQMTLFMESFYRSKTNIDNIKIDPLDERYIVDESNFKVLAEWEHFTVLDLFDLDSFEVSTDNIAEKLGISKNRAEVVLNNLITSGLLNHDNCGKYQKVHPDVRTTEDIKSSALQKGHQETLDIAKEKIEEIEVNMRDYSSTTVAIDLAKLPEAKTIIREFRQKMSALLRDGNKTEVYQLAIQFFPLTNLNTEQENKL